MHRVEGVRKSESNSSGKLSLRGEKKKKKKTPLNPESVWMCLLSFCSPSFDTPSITPFSPQKAMLTCSKWPNFRSLFCSIKPFLTSVPAPKTLVPIFLPQNVWSLVPFLPQENIPLTAKWCAGGGWQKEGKSGFRDQTILRYIFLLLPLGLFSACPLCVFYCRWKGSNWLHSPLWGFLGNGLAKVCW